MTSQQHAQMIDLAVSQFQKEKSAKKSVANDSEHPNYGLKVSYCICDFKLDGLPANDNIILVVL